jgi:aspartate-semialdehyde dehydrogenase
MQNTQLPPRIKVGVLGITGMVGQRFALLLQNHPRFELAAVGASPRSVGTRYADAVSWHMSEPIPPALADMVVQACEPVAFTGCPIIFSGLDAAVAGELEMAFVLAEFAVFSNAKNHRMHPLVPLVVPLVNAHHLRIIPFQRRAWGVQRGFLVTNANCSTTGLAVALQAMKCHVAPLARVLVTTMQAISGAGYPGVASLNILGNVVPHIGGEEGKIESELAKILGAVRVNAEPGFTNLPGMRVSASCNRVPVIDGHMGSVFVEFAEGDPSVDTCVDAVKRAFSTYIPPGLKTLSLLASPLLPAHAIVLREEVDRPQPRLDALTGSGMSVVVGRVRACPVFERGIKFTLLAHNTVLGAAGSSILNAEIAVAMEYCDALLK